MDHRLLVIEPKIEKQMSKRGWTRREIENTIANPYRIVETRDRRWRIDGSRRDEPARAYLREDGHYVVRNEVTGTLVQISNRNKPNWRSPFDLEM